MKSFSLAFAFGLSLLTFSSSAPTATETLAKATFAGGCFWCMEGPFDELEGVVSTTSGYTGGSLKNPTYGQISGGGTGHTEAVQVRYDPSKISYAELLTVFWHNVDPTVKDRQFCDVGNQYRTGVFYHDEEQKRLANQSKDQLATGPLKGKDNFTEITAASTFYPAEDYHQDYYQRNPIRYNYYRYSCGRDQRLEEIWGKAAGKH